MERDMHYQGKHFSSSSSSSYCCCYYYIISIMMYFNTRWSFRGLTLVQSDENQIRSKALYTYSDVLSNTALKHMATNQNDSAIILADISKRNTRNRAKVCSYMLRICEILGDFELRPIPLPHLWCTEVLRLRDNLRTGTETGIFDQTIRNCVKASHLRCRLQATRPPLLPRHRTARHHWYTLHNRWHHVHWGLV